MGQDSYVEFAAPGHIAYFRKSLYNDTGHVNVYQSFSTDSDLMRCDFIIFAAACQFRRCIITPSGNSFIVLSSDAVPSGTTISLYY